MVSLLLIAWTSWLSHMIPSRVDIYLGITHDRVKRKLIQFNRLGFVSLGDNISTDYCVRELKSINIGYNAEYIRLVLSDCHKNKLNHQNQVGLAAIRVIGRKLEGHEERNVSRATANSISSMRSDEADLDIKRSKIDEQLSTWIDSLSEQKKLCVQAEDYQGARIYKQWSRTLLALANEIEELEVEKLRAVNVEDFDEAERLKLVIRDKTMDAQLQMAKSGIQIADDGTILLDRYDYQIEKQSDSSVSDGVSSTGDHVNETGSYSSTTASIASVENPPTSSIHQTFIPTLRTSKILRKSSSRSLKSSSSMTVSSRMANSVQSNAVSPPPIASLKASAISSDPHSQPLISFTPSPGAQSPELKSNTHIIPRPSMIPTKSEDTKTALRANPKPVNTIRAIPSRIPSPKDKHTQVTDDGDIIKEATATLGQSAIQEPAKEDSPPRRGTVAKLERQLAELRLMAAGSGQIQTRFSSESNIPKATTMLKKPSVETFKSTAAPATHVDSGNSTTVVATEKKTTTTTHKPVKPKNGLARNASYAKSKDRTLKAQSKVKSHTRDDDRPNTKNTQNTRKKTEDKKKSSTCIFCEEQNDSFNEDTLNRHGSDIYYKKEDVLITHDLAPALAGLPAQLYVRTSADSERSLFHSARMGISRDSRHKRSATGAKRAQYRKKRKFELGRQAANTKLGPKRVHEVRVRGGNKKYRALRLDAGNFSWGSENCTRKTRVLTVVYNASNNELVRTNTLVKGAVIQVDATPFRQWYEAHYAQTLGKKKGTKAAETEATTEKKSNHVQRKLASRKADAKVDSLVEDQFTAGRLYAKISSRPGQSGRCDGYILEGQELEFYVRKLKARK
ncbi:unnamed protein product [Umbelopsis vinacea]